MAICPIGEKLGHVYFTLMLRMREARPSVSSQFIPLAKRAAIILHPIGIPNTIVLFLGIPTRLVLAIKLGQLCNESVLDWG